MSEKLQKSLAFLNAEMPNNWLSLAVTTLPKRNVFQSIGDFFSGKSGKSFGLAINSLAFSLN